MLSTEYSAEISPDPFLRQVVQGSGALLGVAGAFLILSLPMAGIVRFFGVVAWGLSITRELMVLRRAWVRCIALNFAANGDVRVLGPDLEWRPAKLVSGSILLRSTGWLRVQAHAGHVFAELVRADGQPVRDWRRLHVIWRHVGA